MILGASLSRTVRRYVFFNNDNYVTPNFSRVTYCYSTFLFHYYYSSTHFCPLRVDFFKMSAVAMETDKMQKNLKTQRLS